MTRAAAYCRVSTDRSDQLGSFESQKLFFERYIESKTGWNLAGIYADEGVTGTSTDDRTGFLKMLDDAYAGKFDVLLTKEVSRFSRNILDAVAYTRALKSIGVAVVFLNDGISTLDPDAELRLGIMAAVAQEESRKTSERVKWGQQRKMERGVVFGPSLLGYDVRGGTMTVEPKGAATVRMIFDMVLKERMGVRSVAAELARRGVASRSGSAVWSGASVLKILRNEKYCGDLVQRKTVTTDYLTHKKKTNRGEAGLITLRDHHEPIVSREDWEAVQAELSRRASKSSASPREAGAHGSRYALSGRIVCAVCGAVYYCRTRKRADGTPYRVWTRRCACGGARRQVREDRIAGCVRRFVAGLDGALLLSGFERILDAAWDADEITALNSEISAISRKTTKLADAYAAGDMTRETYLELRDKYAACLRKLEDKARALKTARQGNTASELRELASSAAAGREEDAAFYLGLVGRAEICPDGLIRIFLRGVYGTPLCIS
jgi:site-specific DNA recombinase